VLFLTSVPCTFIMNYYQTFIIFFVLSTHTTTICGCGWLTFLNRIPTGARTAMFQKMVYISRITRRGISFKNVFRCTKHHIYYFSYSISERFRLRNRQLGISIIDIETTLCWAPKTRKSPASKNRLLKLETGTNYKMT